MTSLVQASELSSWLQQTVDIATANLLLAQATALVQAATGQTLVQTTNDTVTIEGSPDAWLTLPQRPVTAVHSVLFADGNLAPTALDPTQYVLIGNRLWRGFGWQYATVLTPPARIPFWKYLTYPPPSSITVTYDHGYPAGHPYLELARTVVLTLAASAFSNPAMSRSVTVDDYTESWADALAGMQIPPSTMALLRRRYGHSAGSVAPR